MAFNIEKKNGNHGQNNGKGGVRQLCVQEKREGNGVGPSGGEARPRGHGRKKKFGTSKLWGGGRGGGGGVVTTKISG